MSILTSRRDFLHRSALFASAAGIARQLSAAAPGNSSASPEAVPLAPPDRQPTDLVIPDPVSRKVGWAIVGLGELALGEIMPAFGQCRFSRPVALVSGHPDKARRVAAVYGIEPKALYDYDAFDRLADARGIEAVYIVLPNSMHAEYTIRALKAGKHVLCEKPMATNVDEAQQMIAAAREAGRKLMIGYRLHYEPFNRRVMQMCANKEFGAIKTFESSNCQNVVAPNIRLSSALAGGPLGDVGIYSINAARYTIGEEPVEVSAMAHQPADDPRFREVPESVVFTLRYPSGVLAHCECGFGSTESRRYRVSCTEGFIEMDPAFSYRGLRLRVKQGDSASGGMQLADLQIASNNHFAAEMDHFSQCILDGSDPRTPGELGLADLKIIAALQEAAQSGRTVKLSKPS